MYKRAEFHLIKERLEEPRRFIQVVMGPRQIGKSTVVKQVLNELKLSFQFCLNIKLIILSGVLCMMCSCTHDSPYGAQEKLDLQWEFSASAITPTTAIVKSMIPDDCEFFLSDEEVKVCLTEKKPDETTPIKAENLIYGDYIHWMPHPSDTFPRFFDKLKPNTTYYAVVKVEIILYDSDGEREIYSDYYFNDYSFTTPPSGDYSGLFDEISCKFDGYSNDMADLKIYLPYGLRLVKDPELRVASSPDMKDFKSYRFVAGSGQVNYASIYIPKKGRYYFEIVSCMAYMDLYNWNGEKLVVKIPNYLDFP